MITIMKLPRLQVTVVPVFFDTYTEQISRATSVEDAQRILQKIIEELGYKQLDYGRGRLKTFSPQQATDLDMTMHLATVNWADRYIERGYQTVDRSVRNSITRSTPWLYSELFDNPTENALQREMEADVKSFVGSGLAIPLHDWHGNVGIMHLGSSLSPAEFVRLDRETRPMVALLSAYFHERIGEILTLNRVAPVLSQRELECLKWAGAGKTNWEISVILRLSEATVKGHMSAALQKLDVRTRAQAVARAISLGVL